MQALHYSVGAGMVCRDPDALRAEKYYLMPPDVGLKLKIMVSCTNSRSSIVRYPGCDKPLVGLVLDGCGFSPPGKPVNHTQGIATALVDWKRSDVVEAAV